VKKRVQASHLNASIFYSMYESFSTLNVAEDCLKQVGGDKSVSWGRSFFSFPPDWLSFL
jgi:hypothetical protein